MAGASSRNGFKTPHDAPSLSERGIYLAVLVAALGYFVDVFDLWLFANFRVASLTAIGLSGEEITRQGAFLLNCQQAGLLLGGVVWGVLGDKLGRSKVLFGSIILYSVGNIANAYVTNVTSYALVRFITGFGLAGEIGAGVTLVAELMPKEKRGLGVTVVATVGVSGAIAAALAGSFLTWQQGFIVGGVMGLSLLVLRVFVHESGLFQSVESRTDVARGSLKLLFSSWERVLRFFSCVVLAIPVWLIFGMYGVFAPEIAESLGITGVKVPPALMYASIGITAGDIVSGLLSQYLKSRKKPMAIFITGALAMVLVLHSGLISSTLGFYLGMGFTGFFTGFWICALATSAEQFGTNLRATVTTMVPNVVRATVIPITFGFVSLKGSLGTANSALCVSLIGFAVTFLGFLKIKESFSTDLDFLER